MNPIANALTQGFSHENILQYLLRHFPHARKQIEQALSKGFTAEKIIQFLQGGRKEVSQPITEHEQARASHKEKQQQLEKGIAKGALALGATGLGAYALNRALPKAAQVLQGELLPALPQGPLQIGVQEEAKQLPFIEGQTQTPIPPVTPIQAENPIVQQSVAQIAPLPQTLKKVVQGAIDSGNNSEQIEAILRFTQPKVVKEYEKSTKTPIKSAIEEFAKSANSNPEIKSMGTGIQEAKQQVERPVPQYIKPINSNAKEEILQSQESQGIQPFSKELDVSQEKIKGNIVALQNGDIGEITNIRQGIATVNANGKEYRRKVEELIESPIPEKDLAELHDELMKGIESKTGQEISRMVNWAGYDPKTNELAFVPHMGALYVYDDISPDDAKELTNILSKRKSTGENFIGNWSQGSQSPIGAAMSKLIEKLQKERGGKGKEYKGKYEKIYDAIEPAKIASKKKFEEKKKRENKNVKKRKTKKPRPD